MANEKKLQGAGRGAAAAATAAPAGTHLSIRALSEGFRRAGRAWSVQAVLVPVEDFTTEQLEQLLAEPQLVVRPADAPAEHAGSGE
jgi:hypothetical protein